MTVKVAPCPSPALSARDRPAVQLDQVAHDGEAEAEAAVRRVVVGVGLPEAVEDVGQELRPDALARVADRDLDVRVDALQPDLHAPAAAA